MAQNYESSGCVKFGCTRLTCFDAEKRFSPLRKFTVAAHQVAEEEQEEAAARPPESL